MKRITQIAAMILFSTGLMAQMSVGIKTGVAVNKYGSSDAIDNQWDFPAQLGYTAGASLDIAFGGRMGLETGIYWTRKGSGLDTEEAQFILTSNSGDVSIFEERKNKLNYLTIPAHLKFNFRGKAIGSYVLVGPEFNFALSGTFSRNWVDNKGIVVEGAEEVLEANGIESNGDIEFGSSKNDELKSFDFGISVGGGLFYELETGRITLDARYFLGMSNILNTEDDDMKLKNRNLFVQVGYAFPLGGGW